jgi:hypothetical protein
MVGSRHRVFYSPQRADPACFQERTFSEVNGGVSSMITVALIARKKPNDRHCYAYDAVLNGRVVVSDSRDPEQI